MMMSLKNIKKLADKKYRLETGLFIVEGEKNIAELLASNFEIQGILGTTQFLNSLINTTNAYDERMQTRIELKEAKADEISKTGTLTTNTTGIAVVKQKNEVAITRALEESQKNIVLVLDDIRDPGNLGTIIRVADWFGVTHIIASPSTVDSYNPKVISATMGSFTRITVSYASLPDVLEEAQKLSIPIITAVMDGMNVHEITVPKNGILLMGSESHGVSDTSLKYATVRVTIPRFGNAESLNVGIATGILLDTLRR